MAKRLILFVEGPGDVAAAPILVGKLLSELSAWDVVQLDSKPFRVGEVNRLVASDCRRWQDWLKSAMKRPDAGAVLLLLDGDIKRVGKKVFCASEQARLLAERAREVGAAATFSASIVFAISEFESWLLAGIDSFVGKPLPDGRGGLKANPEPVPDDIEASRDAKGWFRRNMTCGYKETIDQALLTRMVSLDSIREKQLRSFSRLEHAVMEIVEGLRRDSPIATPNS